MPKGRDTIIKLNSSRTPDERKKIASKAGKASGVARRNYANLKKCFREQMTDEMMEQAFQKLWKMFINKGNLGAFDRIAAHIDDVDTTQNNITITFGSDEMKEYGD